MIVAISVACGAAIASDPMPNTRCRYSVVNPIDSADAVTPMMSPSC
jgi:hypothetical protein